MSNDSQFRNQLAAIIEEPEASDETVFSEILLVLSNYCKNQTASSQPTSNSTNSVWGQLTTHLEEAQTILNMVEDGVFDQS